MAEEVWKVIVDYPNYAVSNLGNIKSLLFKDRLLKGTDNLGYRRVKLINGNNNTRIMIHRLVVKTFLGLDDSLDVDHINGNRSDNRLCNLRVCSRSENACNTTVKGVYFHKQSGKYRARIRKQGKHYSLGLYSTEKEARLAYLEGCRKYHGEFIDRKVI